MPCAAEAPQLDQLAKLGVAIYAVAIRDRPEDITDFLKRYGDPYRRIGSDPTSSVQIAMGSSGVPETFVVDGKGIIRPPAYRRHPPRKCTRDIGRAGEGAVRASAGLCAALAVLAFAAPLRADSSLPPAPLAYTQLPDPAQEAQAKALMESLRCLVCQGQSIADSDAELAGDMRALVRQRIAAGEKPDDIRAWLVARYGKWVSL